jgi:hypothetical protein
MKPTKGSRWLRICGDGLGMRHEVVEATENYVCTWSEPDPLETRGGSSWMGPVEMFLHEFREVKG